MRADPRLAAGLALALALALSVATATPGAAAAPSAQAARAEALFVEGRALYDQGHYDKACGKLAESQRLEPRVGTEGLLASCYEQQGRLASAYRHYRQAEALARRTNDPRVRYAADHAVALEAKVPRLRIRVASAAPGLKVLRDGQAVAAADLGQDLLVDPGYVEIAADAPGRAGFRRSVQLQTGTRAVVDIPELAPLAAQAASEAGPAPEVLEASPAPEVLEGEATAEEGGGSSQRRTLGLVAGAVGLAGLGVGAGFGALALVKSGESSGFCDAADRCAPAGGALRDEARTAANVSTVSFAVGLVGLGAGAVLLLLPEKSGRSDAARTRLLPLAGPDGAGAALRGTF